MPPKDDKTDQRRDEVLRRMLNTPPKHRTAKDGQRKAGKPKKKSG
jgi:hypothetical protein